MNYIDLTNEASGGGTSNYNDLSNKPQINSITLSGNKTLTDLSIADINASNFSTTGKSKITSLAYPSATVEILTLPESSTTIIAPACGWYFLQKISSDAGQYVALSNKTSGYWTAGNCYSPASGYHLNTSVPANKGDEIYIQYNAGGATSQFFFVYAKGEV